MTTRHTLVAELERLADALSTEGGVPAERLQIVPLAERIAKSLGVRTDEVAIMAVSLRWKHLYFLAPAELKNIGFVPLSSNSALAARTAREAKAEIVNNFAAVRHASGERDEARRHLAVARQLADATASARFRRRVRDLTARIALLGPA